MKKIIYILIAVVFAACQPGVLLAEDPPASGPIIQNPLGAIDTLPKLLTRILDIVVQVGMPIVVLMIVFTGFKYITAQGNPGKLSGAHKALGFTLLGAFIVLGSHGISQLIQETVDNIENGSGESSYDLPSPYAGSGRPPVLPI